MYLEDDTHPQGSRLGTFETKMAPLTHAQGARHRRYYGKNEDCEQSLTSQKKGFIMSLKQTVPVLSFLAALRDCTLSLPCRR